jgi:tetratricopeptide (TPR) repeat protein
VGVLGQVDEAQRTLLDVANDARLPQYARADCWGNMANLAIDRHDATMARDAATQALALWEAAPRRSVSQHLKLLLYRSVAESLNGQPGKADAGYAAIMDELRRMGRDRGPLSSEVRNNRRSDAIRSGDLKLALTIVDEEIAIVKHDFPDRPLPVLPLYERSKILAWQGYSAQALSGFDQVIELAISDRAIAQRALLDSARVLSQLGRNAEAERRYRSAVAANAPVGAGLVAPAQLDLASLLVRAQLDLDLNQYVATRQDISAALQIKGAPLFSLAYAHRLRALADLGAHGDLDEALLDARFARDATERLRGDKPYSFWVGQADLVLGQVLRSQGDGQGARKVFAEAKDQLLQSVGDEHPDTRQARSLMRAASRELR